MTAGTIFQDSHLPLPLWFEAMWYVTRRKTGTSAVALQALLGLGNYKTAWAMLHKLRRAMSRPSKDRLRGLVEVTVTHWVTKEKGRAGGAAERKALILVAAEQEGAGIGRIRLRRISELTKETVQEFIEGSVRHGSTVKTDCFKNNGGSEVHASRRKVERGSGAMLPRAHRVSSLLKRWLLETHQGAIGEANLDYYLGDFAFRYSSRKLDPPEKRFRLLAQKAVQTPHSPYSSLIKSRQEKGTGVTPIGMRQEVRRLNLHGTRGSDRLFTDKVSLTPMGDGDLSPITKPLVKGTDFIAVNLYAAGVPDVLLILGDCNKVMRRLNPEAVDVVVTDPPYNVKKDYGVYKDSLPEDAFWAWIEKIRGRFDKFTEKQAWVVGKHKLRQWWNLLPEAHMIPVRRGAARARRTWLDSYGAILVKGYDGPAVRDLWEDIRLPDEGYFYREERYRHPGITPLQLMARPLQMLAKPGQTVLDPFVGTGTCGVAAVAHGSNFVGIELNPPFFEVACKRIEQSLREHPSFEGDLKVRTFEGRFIRGIVAGKS